MSGRIFVDTNILVYCFDGSSPAKKEKANLVMKQLWDNSNGILSLQVLKEFFVIVTSKLPARMDIQTAKSAVFDLMSWTVFHENRQSLEKAFELVEKHRFSFWDANILSAAILSDCEQVFSEDLQHQQSIEGVQIINPFLFSENYP